jgi:Ca2+:H+ antiporter
MLITDKLVFIHMPHAGGMPHDPAWRAMVKRDAVLLVATVLPIVLLSKTLGVILDRGLVAADAPLALGGLLIAMIIFTPTDPAQLEQVREQVQDYMQRLQPGSCPLM